MAELGLVLAVLAGTGANLEPVLLTDGAGAALRGDRNMRSAQIKH